MEEKYFEIPITVISPDGDIEDFKTYIAKGDEDFVRVRAAKVIEEEFKGKEYDYDVIEISPDQYETLSQVEFLPGTEDSDSDENSLFDRELAPRSMEDEMEDLTDRYYTLEDRLNSIPDENLDEQLVTDARLELNKAKDYFDQYDFFKCKESLNKADDIISQLSKE